MLSKIRLCFSAVRLWTAIFFIGVFVLSAGVPAGHAQPPPPPAADDLPDFTQFSLEELKNVEIISASKRPEKLSEATAAVFVITQEDIRRSGATSIPEILRLATGVHVARITATDWAVNIRGLNNRFARNLLVLIDGRSVYTHVFSGVFWDIQDTVIEDIQRIEVIRGPGAALWGANAVNGVINIITKNSRDTQGGQAVVLGGNKEQLASVRYGDSVGTAGYYRMYSKFFHRGKLTDVVDDFQSADIGSVQESQQSKNWISGRGGFRMDLTPGAGLPDNADDSYTLQGEVYSNRYDREIDRQSITLPESLTSLSDTSRAAGGHLMGVWRHRISATSESSVQGYIEHAKKDYEPSSGEVSTADLDFQHNFRFAERHDVVWGFEYRFITDEFDNSQTVSMTPQDQDLHYISTFVQDIYQIVPETLELTLGTKLEHNGFTGLEIQPSLRVLYKPKDRHVLWAAVSRAVRVPSRLEHDGKTDELTLLSGSQDPVHVITIGDDDLTSEKLTAFELGYRMTPLDTLWLDSTIFYNVYDDLIGLSPLDTDPADDAYVFQYRNNADGEAYGLELTADWQATREWRLGVSYTYLRTHIDRVEIEEEELDDLISEGSNPRVVISLRSMMNITPEVEFDTWLRFVDSLSEKDVDSYTTLDARLAWRPLKAIEISLVGQNLFEQRHPEFSSFEIERSVYGKIDLRF